MDVSLLSTLATVETKNILRSQSHRIGKSRLFPTLQAVLKPTRYLVFISLLLVKDGIDRFLQTCQDMLRLVFYLHKQWRCIVIVCYSDFFWSLEISQSFQPILGGSSSSFSFSTGFSSFLATWQPSNPSICKTDMVDLSRKKNTQPRKLWYV